MGRLPMGVVDTLDPNKFAEKNQQRFHISGHPSIGPRISLLNQSSPVRVPRLDYVQRKQIIKDPTIRTLVPYPQDTNAFLYYFMPPDKPPIGGELRFRVTSSDDPASFGSGSDLLRPDSLPWSRSLFALSKYYFPLYEKLREERFVSDDLDAALLTLPSFKANHVQSQRLYTLNDTFIVDFSKPKKTFVITEQGVEILQLGQTFFDVREKKCEYAPYTGAYTNHHLLY
jgi:hypothetical protein